MQLSDMYTKKRSWRKLSWSGGLVHTRWKVWGYLFAQPRATLGSRIGIKTWKTWGGGSQQRVKKPWPPSSTGKRWRLWMKIVCLLTNLVVSKYKCTHSSFVMATLNSHPPILMLLRFLFLNPFHFCRPFCKRSSDPLFSACQSYVEIKWYSKLQIEQIDKNFKEPVTIMFGRAFWISGWTGTSLAFWNMYLKHQTCLACISNIKLT